MAMAMLRLERFGDAGLGEDDVLARLAWLRDVVGPRLERYLGYYRNPTIELGRGMLAGRGVNLSARAFRQYQEMGLPARITGLRYGADGTGVPEGGAQRKEVVIENDIAWRVDTLVDFAAARMPVVTSAAKEDGERARLNGAITGILESGRMGLVGLMEELVRQGSICGSVWVGMRPTGALLERLGAGATTDAAEGDVGRWMELTVVEARRVIEVRTEAGAFVVVLREVPAAKDSAGAAAAREGILARMRGWFSAGKRGAGVVPVPAAEEFSFDIYGAKWWQRYECGVLTGEGENPLGFVPFVKFENAPDLAAGTRVGPDGAQAGVNVGMGDVEPLMGMQDELNTRLSDRAYRVTMSSFQMYLGKGIEDFVKRPVGPGQMWATDNHDASIETFGGDMAAPSEEAHINEVREALDKISGTSPVAAGLIRGKVGNLTSAVALRLTLIALLARTERKRAALTRVLEEIVRLGLAALDKAGIVKSAAGDREIDVNWPSALPASDMDKLNEAKAKVELGVPRGVVLRELGYEELVVESEKPALAAAAVPESGASSEIAGAGPG